MKKPLIRTILLILTLLCATTSLWAQPSARPKIGLVLGGGGAKGAATVGALKYIEQAGIPIDCIAGTSIGAIIGGLYACGYRSAQLDSLFRSQDWTTLLSDRDTDVSNWMFARKNGVTYFFGFPIGGRRSSRAEYSAGIMRGDSVLHLLDSLTCRPDSMSFDSLPIPFRCVATDIHRREKVVLSSGHLATAMRASMSIPGAFKAVRIDSLELLDGGLTDNLPVDVAREMGADVIIAIDLTQDKHEDEDVGARLNRRSFRRAKTYLGRLLRWTVQRPDLPQYQENLRHVDIYINPDLKGYGATSFSDRKVARMITLGEKAGAKALKALKRLRKRLGGGE